MLARSRLLYRVLLITLPIALFAWVHERNSWRPSPLPGFRGAIHALAFSPDGRFLVAEGDQSRGAMSTSDFCFWDTKTHVLLNTQKGTSVSSANNLFFSPDGKQCFASIWGVEEGDLVFWQTPDGDWSKTATYSSWLPLSVSKSRADAALSEAEHDDILGYKVSSAALSPDGKTLAVASLESATSVGLWDAKTHRLIHRLPPMMTDSFCVAFSPDGKTLAVGTTSRYRGDSDSNLDSYVILLWDWRAKKRIRSLRRHTTPIYSLAYSPDGKFIASGSDDGTAKLWNVKTGSCTRTYKTGTSIQVAFSPDGKTMALTGSTLTLIDVATGNTKRTFPASAVAAFSPDGRTLASEVGGQINLWRLK